MLSHTGTLWQYLGSFVGYTLFAVGLIYVAYWFIRKNPNSWLMGNAFQAKADAKAPVAPLAVEANLSLEPRKSLYIVRAGHERFLISTTMEQTQCLARLESEQTTLTTSQVADDAMDEAVELPWFTAERLQDDVKNPMPRPNSGFGSRLVQSVQWLMESRK